MSYIEKYHNVVPQRDAVVNKKKNEVPICYVYNEDFFVVVEATLFRWTATNGSPT